MISDAHERGAVAPGSGPRVLHIPEWRDANSYLDRLAGGLEAEGVVVVFPSQIERRALSLHDLEGIDLVHVHWPEAYTSAASALGALLRSVRFAIYLRLIASRGIGLVWTAHNLGPHEPRWPRLDRWVHRRLARHADRVIVHYPAAERSLVEWLEDESVAVEVIEHPAFPVGAGRSMLDAREKLGIESDRPVVLYLGAIRRYKDVPRLIAAFRRSAPPDAKLIVAGWVDDDGLAEEIGAEAADDPRVETLLEFVSEQDLGDLMAAADAVAVPHRSGLTKGSAVLAMSHGKAVLGSRCPHLEYLLGSTQRDLLFDPGDVESMAGVIAQALGDRAGLHAIGARNQGEISKSTWALAARQLRQLYGQVLGGGA